MTAPAPDIKLIPAATVILFRENGDGAPELLMMRRGAGMAFAPNALVFPGGRVDAGDHAVARDPVLFVHPLQHEEDEIAARVCAIRETIEEVGLAIGIVPQPDHAETSGLRAALADGADFAAVLASTHYRLDVRDLTLFAWWRPMHPETRNFDTRFYIAAAPAGGRAEEDGGEAVQVMWRSARDLLADHDAGRVHMILPTRSNLERLAAFAALDNARADAVSRQVRPLTPHHERRGDEIWVTIPDDQGYPVTKRPL